MEITSKDNPVPDRTTRRDAYARGGVDVYLLIDRCAEPKPRVTVYSNPADGTHQRSIARPFGEAVHLARPIDLELDTSRFR
ncbi:MAG TPA: Uma2 family endonuclease [Amycolatopsis sp.]|nr:Uma2 family endonuclease [Amycolatopsis sp.]